MNILLGVTGSISAYKAFDLCRAWIKNNHQVKVVLSSGALQFVQPQVFRYLGCDAVFLPTDDFNSDAHNEAILHIELANWCDQFVIAPLSANTQAKLAFGLADDLLTSIFLALKESTPITLFPAMNTKMLNNPISKRNEKLLSDEYSWPKFFIHSPSFGELACGEIGQGKLPDVSIIQHIVESRTNKESGRKILISTGATQSPLDPVRYLTNPSSGKTGFELAKRALSLGHQVTVIAGRDSTPLLDTLVQLPGYKLVRIRTPQEMLREVKNEFDSSDAYISSAAIGDISFGENSEKIKKASIGNSLPIEDSPDILKEILKVRNEGQKIIGFAAETDLSDDNLNNKLKTKPVDLLVGTKVYFGDEVEGFANDQAEYDIRTANNSFFKGKLSKRHMSQKIMEFIESHDSLH